MKSALRYTTKGRSKKQHRVECNIPGVYVETEAHIYAHKCGENVFQKDTQDTDNSDRLWGEELAGGGLSSPSYTFQYNLDFLIIGMNCIFKMLHRDL